MRHFKLFKIITVLILFLTQLGYAQVKIGVKGGYSLDRLTNSTENVYTDKYETTGGFDWGFLVEIPLTELISIQPELNFTQRGGVRNGSQPVQTAPLAEGFNSVGFSLEQLNQLIFFSGGEPISDENPFYADYDAESSLRYLEIPILLKLGWGSNWRFYVEGGPNIGVLLSAEQITAGESRLFYDEGLTMPLMIPNVNFQPGSGEPPFLPVEFPSIPLDDVTDTKPDLETLSVGVQIGFGLIKVFGNNEIFIDARTSYGLSTIQRDKTFGETHVGGIIFSLGYSYTL